MTTFIRVVGEPKEKSKYTFHFTHLHDFNILSLVTAEELEKKLEQLKVANQKLQRNSRGSFHGVHDDVALIRRSSSDNEEPIHIHAETTSTASQITTTFSIIVVFVSLLTIQRY